MLFIKYLQIFHLRKDRNIFLPFFNNQFQNFIFNRVFYYTEYQPFQSLNLKDENHYFMKTLIKKINLLSKRLDFLSR